MSRQLLPFLLWIFWGGCREDAPPPTEVAGSVEAKKSPIPPRPAGAPTGSEFLSLTAGLSIASREEAILAQVTSGNIPDFLRMFVEVTVSVADTGGTFHTTTFSAMPDYLAIGSDQDFVRIPIGSRTAQKIADLFECSLVTRKMVNDVWKAASVKLAPIPMTPGPSMLSNQYFGTHQQKIEAARAGKPLGALTAGQKKDVVLSNKLQSQPTKVAIYGWHKLNGTPIQPLSTVHHHAYADYSHGIRLILETVTVDGKPMPAVDVLKSATLHPLLSDEGVMPSPRIPGV